MIVAYETDPEALKKVIPAPLKPAPGNIVLYEWINMPDSSGFGSYSESGTVIPVVFNGEICNFTLQMYLDNEPPIACGREIWGFPKKYGRPEMITRKDTLVGKLQYSGQEVAMGTMSYKYKKIPIEEAKKSLGKTQINLKLIPGVDKKKPDVAQLIGYNIEDVTIKEAWEGPAKLHLVPHINAPTLKLPIKRFAGGKHIIADLTLPYGRVLHDYLQDKELANYDWNVKEHPSVLDFSKKEDVLKSVGMPLVAPSYSGTPFELKNREHLIFRYRSDPEAIARALPEPLIPNEKDEVLLIFTKTEGSGIGKYGKCDMFIPAYYHGKYVFYGVQGYVDASASRTAGREVYGLPLKVGQPNFKVEKDTLVANLRYSDQEIVMGTMTYHYSQLNSITAKQFLKTPQINLKFIPGVQQGKIDVAGLTMFHYEDVVIKEAYKGPANLHIVPHVNAPICDLPIIEMLEGNVILADVTMSEAKLVHDYILDKSHN